MFYNIYGSAIDIDPQFIKQLYGSKKYQGYRLEELDSKEDYPPNGTPYIEMIMTDFSFVIQKKSFVSLVLINPTKTYGCEVEYTSDSHNFRMRVAGMLPPDSSALNINFRTHVFQKAALNERMTPNDITIIFFWHFYLQTKQT